MQLKIAICDDENIICNEIKKQLLLLNPNYKIDTYNSGIDFLKNKKIYDILFIDIEMPELNGLKLAQKLREENINSYIIFLTGHMEYIQEAFKVKAFRFLEKPICKNKFIEAVKNAENEILSEEKITIVSKKSIYLVNLQEILCIEAFGDGTYIYLKDKVLESRYTLKYWIEQINKKQFFQVHKSYIISFKHVKNFNKSEIFLSEMRTPVPLSRRKGTQFKEAYLEYIKNYANFL